MVMMEWNPSLEVGHSMIDRDHKRLVDLINTLGEAMSTGQGSTVCAHVLNELIDYTKYHFANEERLMSRHRYAKTSEHTAEHAKLVKDVVEFQQRFAAGTVVLSVSLLHFLMEWLTHHILESDKALAKAISRG